MSDETKDTQAQNTQAQDTQAQDTPEVADKPKAVKKEKAPAVEDKPFQQFIEQDCIPALQKALTAKGLTDLYLSLEQQNTLPGLGQVETFWQLCGQWNKTKRQFSLYFLDGDIQGQRLFSCADCGSQPSTIEPFLIDERKITLDLLVFGVVQRLNGQKWLLRN